MSKKQADPLVSFAGSFQQVVCGLDERVTAHGGNLAEAVAHLRKPEHVGDLDRIAGILALVCARAQESSAATPAKPALLEPIDTVNVPALPQFVAKNKFVVDTGRKARAKISYLGDNFKAWFLGKVEGPAAEATLRAATLRRSSVDAPILAELSDTAETTLGQKFWLMEQQPSGEGGTLLNDGRANIFYILDNFGALRAVFVDWRGDGWCVYARSVEYPRPWRDGYRVFSRNSLVAQVA